MVTAPIGHSELIEIIWRTTKQRKMCEILFFFKHAVARVMIVCVRMHSITKKGVS